MSRKTTLFLITIFIGGTALALYYAGWRVDIGGAPANEALANAATFASMVTAAVAILISGLAIWLEQKRADERDESAPVAWTAAERLANAIHALDWTLIDVGHLTPESTPADIRQYRLALAELFDALTKATEFAVARVLGVRYVSSDEENGGVAASAVISHLRASIGELLESDFVGLPDTRDLRELNCLYRSIAALDWLSFRQVWEKGVLPARYALVAADSERTLTERLLGMRRPTRRSVPDWGEELFVMSAVIRDDIEQGRSPSAHLVMMLPIDLGLSARFRVALASGYAHHPSVWWRSKGSFEHMSAGELEQVAGLGGIWYPGLSPSGLRAAHFVDAGQVSWGWHGILGRTDAPDFHTERNGFRRYDLHLRWEA